jgi:hypothetical protein
MLPDPSAQFVQNVSDLADDVSYSAYIIDVHRSLLPFWHAGAVGVGLRSDRTEELGAQYKRPASKWHSDGKPS